MKISSLTIHNFRSILEEKIYLNDYSLLIGANNCGKSNIIDALRVYFEKDGYKYDNERDFPKDKLKPQDKEVWIEVTYLCVDAEFESLKDEYRLKNNTFTVRKIIKTEQLDKSGKPMVGIFGYENGKLSNNSFYGQKNVSQGKLGDIIYIPASSKYDETIKTSGPSPFRDLINNIVKKLIITSPSYKDLGTAVDEFTNKFKTEETEDGHSFESLENDLSSEISDWEVKFKLGFNELKEDDIVKTLVSHKIWDNGLDSEIQSFGQGLQRNLIFSLIKLSNKYNKKVREVLDKQLFVPELTLLLFEEPEAFLHPPQEVNLHRKLKEFGSLENQQVLVSTHSSNIVNKNIQNMLNLIKVNKYDNQTHVYQIIDTSILFNQNDKFKSTVKGTKYENKDKQNPEISEGIKYFLWLNPDRASCFFAKNVLLVEGPTEKCFFDFLIENKFINLDIDQLYILDCMGKFNIHRFMNLFKLLGINHYILFDEDTGHSEEVVHKNINSFIISCRNEYTKAIGSIDPDIEKYLEADKPDRDYKKPFFLIYQYQQNPTRFEKKITGLESILNKLFAFK